MTERLLAKEGFSAICTDSPSGVLQLARTIKPYAIFIDVLMPGLDGWDVLQTLKTDAGTAEIPVVMLSVLEERQKAKAEKAIDFIEKPLDQVKLKRALGKISNSTLIAAGKRAIG